MTIHDISLTSTPGMLTWEGDEAGYSLEWIARMDADTIANVSIITNGTHTGTHLDAPLHFIKDGKTVETLDVNVLVGPAQLVEIYNRPTITAEDLEGAAIHADTRRLILKTDNTRLELLKNPVFQYDYIGVAPSGASWLVEHGIQLIGVDYLSVGPHGDDNVITHNTLLGAGVVVVENLDVSAVSPGNYWLAALPPKFAGAEGSPCRVILIEGM